MERNHSKPGFRLGLVALLAGVWSGPALADPNEVEPSAADPIEAIEVEEVEEADESARIQDLEDKLEALDARLRQSEEQKARPGVVLRVGGYADFGFFVPEGDGSGVVQDVGNAVFPEYTDRFAWMFLGDVLAPTVNTRGEAASLGDLPNAERFDSVRSRGAPGFLVNEVNLSLVAGLSSKLLVSTSVNFVPRTGSEFALGDVFDLDIAQLEWIPFDSGKVSVFFGKFDSVIGIEYRDRKANQRFGVTPTLLHRYTSGTPLGIKARAKFFDADRLVVAAAVTNGSSTTEQFHFAEEGDSNFGKTVSGRVSLRLPVPGHFEVGASGEYGAQDRARSSADPLWFVGVDMLYFLGDLSVKAQWLRGGAPGDEMDRVYGLMLNRGGYLEVDYMVTPKFGLIGRGEVRDAFVWLGTERGYLTKSWRAVGGARVVFNEHLVMKAEYLLNGEYGGIPQIPNNVFTTSLLVSY